jgi:hypothetical protein
VSGDLRGQAAREIHAILPDRADDLTRPQLIADGGVPVVTVVGKYNHCKSLLNELLGQQAFAVSPFPIRAKPSRLSIAISRACAGSMHRASMPM